MSDLFDMPESLSPRLLPCLIRWPRKAMAHVDTVARKKSQFHA